MALLCSGRPAYLDQLTPRGFEELIASLFRNHGFTVELTARTRNGGYDIVAVSSSKLSRETVQIEVKHFAPDRPVGVGVGRALYGVKHLKRASRVVLATSSHVSTYAKREFARAILWEIDFVECEKILDWCGTYAADIIKSRVHDFPDGG
jgi:restriction system protein